MPKPVKKKAGTLPVPAKPKRPSDPNRAAKSILAEHMARATDFELPGMTVTFGPETEHSDEVIPSDLEKFEAMYKARMASLGSKGGKASGARRMEMPEKQRKAIAKKAADARWGKAKGEQ